MFGCCHEYVANYGNCHVDRPCVTSKREDSPVEVTVFRQNPVTASAAASFKGHDACEAALTFFSSGTGQSARIQRRILQN